MGKSCAYHAIMVGAGGVRRGARDSHISSCASDPEVGVRGRVEETPIDLYFLLAVNGTGNIAYGRPMKVRQQFSGYCVTITRPAMDSSAGLHKSPMFNFAVD